MMTMPQASLPPSATSIFGMQPQLDPNSALAQAQFNQSNILSSMNGMQQPSPYPIGSGGAEMPQMSQAPVGGGSGASASVLTPDVLKRYIAKEGIGSPAQAAQVALLAWKNGDIAVAQFAAKIATNYSLSKLIAGQDGDANSISWADLGKLAKGKSAIGRDDIGAAPDLTEALESDLKAMAGLAMGASTQNQWDPYATMSGVGGQQQQPYPAGQQPMGYPNSGQQPMQGQPATINGVNGTVVMMPYAQAQQYQQSKQGQILPQSTAGMTPLQQSMQLAGMGGSMGGLMQEAGLSAPGTYPQQQPQGGYASPMPAAMSQPISYGGMLPQQGQYPQQPTLGQPQQQGYPQSPMQGQYPQQQQMAAMPITLPGTYRLSLTPTF